MLSDYQRAVAELHEAFEAFNVLMHQESQQLDQFHLTTQQEVLLQYVIRNQPITANAIATKFLISKSAVSQVLSKLEQRLFIKREHNPSNRRESFIVLCKEGLLYAELIQQLDEVLIEKYYSRVGVQDIQDIVKTIRKMMD